MEHIVLEYDKDTRAALVVATSGGREPVLSGHASPYIVADGYDFESRTWGAGPRPAGLGRRGLEGRV